MKSVLRLIVLGLGLAGCVGPLSLYYRPGVSVTRMETDTTNCQVKALRDAPVANQIRQRPPIFLPGRQYCNAGGCYYQPGYWIDGGIYTVDVNAELRGRVEDQCMAQKGYQPVSVPRCNQAIATQVPQGQTRILPQISEASCAIRYDDGSWQIVTPVTTASQ